MQIRALLLSSILLMGAVQSSNLPNGWYFHADYPDYPVNDSVEVQNWVTRPTVEGCIVYEVFGVMNNAGYKSFARSAKLTRTWSSATKCTPGQPITGYGVMRTVWNVSSTLKAGETYSGNIVNGYWQGDVVTNGYVGTSVGRTGLIPYRGGCANYLNIDVRWLEYARCRPQPRPAGLDLPPLKPRGYRPEQTPSEIVLPRG